MFTVVVRYTNELQKWLMDSNPSVSQSKYHMNYFFTNIIIICKIENQTASMGHKVFIFHVPNGHDLDVVYAHAGYNTIPPYSDFLC